MKKRLLAYMGCLLLGLGTRAQAANASAPADGPEDPLQREQKHFVECLATVYSPAWWLSYNGSLYFQPRDEAQAAQLEAMKAARAQYVALTNRATRHALASALLARSGIGEAWQKKLLLPLSETNYNLTPTLARSVRVVPAYRVVQSSTNGDALIEDGQSTLFVMNFGRAAADASRTNALLIREGTKTYSAGGAFQTVDAFENVGLSQEETAVLNRVAATCRREAASLGRRTTSAQDKAEFEARRARATDSNPYMEYLLAKAYLDGMGTERDEKLGMEWMRRAAKSGSGDAVAYLKAREDKAP
jgi:TPR repeat protein